MAFLRKSDDSRTIPLRPRLTVIGREPGCDIVVPRGEVSGRHAIIVNVGGSHYIEDLHSLNGTIVNGQRINRRTLLVAGDRLEVPGLDATFQDVASAAGESPQVVMTPAAPVESVAASVVSSLSAVAPARADVAPEAKLRAVMQISEALGSTLALDKVLPTILETLFAIFPKATRGFILLRDPETGKLVPKAVYPQTGPGAPPPALSLTVIDQALATGRAILTVDAGRDQRFNASDSIRHLRLHSIMCAPMISPSGTTLGVIQIDTMDSASVFRQDDLDVLLCASGQAARAIELVRAHEELRDLEAANRIQHSFLPQERPQLSGLEFFDHYLPARQVGGDYFDYIPLPGNRLAIALGDVAGKGMSAALLMARLSAAARFCLATTSDVAAAVGRLNDELSRTFGADRFATFVVAVLDMATFNLTVVNAGHLPPLRCPAGGAAPELVGEDAAGLPLAGIDWPYEPTVRPLEPGDRVILYSDGVTEARNPDGALYGADRLRAAAAKCDGGAAALGQAILADVRAFASGRPPSDDLTLVCLARTDG